MGGGIDKEEVQGCWGLDSPVNFPTGGGEICGGGGRGALEGHKKLCSKLLSSPLSEWPALTLAAAIGGMEKRRR